MRSNHPSRHAHDKKSSSPAPKRPLRQQAKARRGESTIIANLILFIGVMGMASATVFVFKNMMDQSTVAAAEEKDRTVSVMRTSFTIPSAVYDDNAGEVLVYVKNTGRETFYPDEMDIYLDGIRVPRNDTNRTIGVTSDSDTVDVGAWNTGEDLEIVVFRTYTIPATRTVTINAPNGVKAESVFSS